MSEGLYNRIVVERLAKNRQTMEPKPSADTREEERIKAADSRQLTQPPPLPEVPTP